MSINIAQTSINIAQTSIKKGRKTIIIYTKKTPVGDKKNTMKNTAQEGEGCRGGGGRDATARPRP